jgi:beta-glucosidase/6-phospho-beta-glucosidase/beta-galactosidase
VSNTLPREVAGLRALPAAMDYPDIEGMTPTTMNAAWYINAALDNLYESIAHGVPVLGYIHWSLLDNFEWTQGYKPKFGLVAVDRTIFKRTPKPSADHLGKIARQNAF